MWRNSCIILELLAMLWRVLNWNSLSPRGIREDDRPLLHYLLEFYYFSFYIFYFSLQKTKFKLAEG